MHSAKFNIIIFVLLYLGDNVSLTELNLKWNHLRMRGAIAVAKGIEVRIWWQNEKTGLMTDNLEQGV